MFWGEGRELTFRCIFSSLPISTGDFIIRILSSGHQLFLCLEVENFLVEKCPTIFRKILLPLCAVDVRRKAASLHLRVFYRSVIRHCYVKTFAILRYHAVHFGIWLVTGTAVRNMQPITRATCRPTITTIRARQLFRVQLLKYFLSCRQLRQQRP